MSRTRDSLVHAQANVSCVRITIATSGSINLVYGKDKIVEELLGLNFEISMKSFFQTNPKCAEKLYNKVVEYVLEDKSKVDNTALR